MTRKEVTKTRDLSFSSWLRAQKDLDSADGFVASDIDFFIHNYKTGKFALLEIKQFHSGMKYAQREIYKKVDLIFRSAEPENYKGLYLIVFEKKDFNDGKCWINNSEITESQLIAFLKYLLV